jgi:hypothetical protein
MGACTGGVDLAVTQCSMRAVRARIARLTPACRAVATGGASDASSACGDVVRARAKG